MADKSSLVLRQGGELKCPAKSGHDGGSVMSVGCTSPLNVLAALDVPSAATWGSKSRSGWIELIWQTSLLLY